MKNKVLVRVTDVEKNLKCNGGCQGSSGEPTGG